MPPNENPLSSPIQYIKGVGPRLAQLLARKGIQTFEDALYFIPRAYEDRRHLTPVGSLRHGTHATVLAKVVSSRRTGQGCRSRFEATLSDGTGSVQLFWFHAFPSLADEFTSGSLFLIHGEVDSFRGIPRIVHPDYEKIKELRNGKPAASFNFGRVVPVYSETEGLNQKTLRKILGEVLKVSLRHLTDPLPEPMRTRLGLPSLRDSFIALHFPKEIPGEGNLSSAVRRVIFEEFFVLQLGLGLKKKRLQSTRAPLLGDVRGMLTPFLRSLPFPLTGDQKRAIAEIGRDLLSQRTMTRLVQGDVGAGKTVIAFAGAVIAASAGYQTAMMAPTELLALQHFKAAERWLKPLGIELALVTSANSAKRKARQEVAFGEAQFVVGTHALFQQGVTFSRLGLVVVDEQHRFGVDQRSELLRKGTDQTPHLLMMTATPIPRTLALTLYGDLDLTLIREKPADRKPIKTLILRDHDRPRLYQKIRQVVRQGEQVYLIYPLVEASEKLDLKSATEMYHSLQKEIFPDLTLGLLHGRMKPEEKESILTGLKEGKFQILVATTVIEVGIDVPNATLMIIEHPERLGLSQLHQLRGRVGRGALESQCILVADEYVTPRLKIMESTEDGFLIAEEDLRLRGPGEFLGTRQSGLPGFRVGHILRDASLLDLAREEASCLLKTDPDMTLTAHTGIRSMVESRWKEKIERLRGG